MDTSAHGNTLFDPAIRIWYLSDCCAVKAHEEVRWTGGCQDGKNQNGERDTQEQRKYTKTGWAMFVSRGIMQAIPHQTQIPIGTRDTQHNTSMWFGEKVCILPEAFMRLFVHWPSNVVFL